MSNVLIITDTVAGIPRELAQKYNIKIIPAAIIRFRDETFIEGETLSVTEAYNLIKKDPDSFSTSALHGSTGQKQRYHPPDTFRGTQCGL